MLHATFDTSPPPPPGETQSADAGPWRRADRVALSVRAALQVLTIPLARASSRFVSEKGWFGLGFARCTDWTKERIDRSSRWVGDLAALGGALDRLPDLEAAISGADGGAPIDRRAAMLIGRVSTAATLSWWVARARQVSVRALREEIVRAREAEGRVGHRAGSGGRAIVAEADRDRVEVRIMVPSPVKKVFDEAVDLFRAIEGGEATVTSFVEALVEEAHAGGAADEADPTVQSCCLERGRGAAEAERDYASATSLWSQLPAAGSVSWNTVLAEECVERVEQLSLRAGSDDPIVLEEVMRGLIEMESALHRRLGALLCEMSTFSAWSRLRFAGLGHYAEQRLGLCRTAARDRVRATRALTRLPRLSRAYNEGRVGLHAVLEVARLLGRGEIDSVTEEAWVERAVESTIKRIRDEVRAFERAATGEGPTPGPMKDYEWHASLRRRPGDACARAALWSQYAALSPLSDVILRVRLPAELADQFLACVKKVGLLAMLEDFISTWDNPEGIPRRRGDEVYMRDGWRCMAPACTSRRNLESHHVKYRSRGGGDGQDNLVSLCRFHHQQGEHGGLAECRGRAPVGLTWRLGLRASGKSYRNERRVSTA